MEPESSGKLATDDRSAAVTRAGDVNERPVEAGRDHAPEQHEPSRIWSVVVGLAVVLTVGALGYF